jgi:hypothetical protein
VKKMGLFNKIFRKDKSSSCCDVKIEEVKTDKEDRNNVKIEEIKDKENEG